VNQKRKAQAAVYAMQIPNHGVGTHLTRCERPTVRWAMVDSSDRGIAEGAAGAGSRTGTARRATPSGLRKERIDCMAERSASGSIASPYLRSVWIEEQIGVPPAKSARRYLPSPSCSKEEIDKATSKEDFKRASDASLGLKVSIITPFRL
jgi:hypothetical protein